MRFSVWSSLRNTAFLYSTAKLQGGNARTLWGQGQRKPKLKFSGRSGPFLGESGDVVPRFPMLGQFEPLSSALSPILGLPLTDRFLPPSQLPSKVSGTQEASAHFLQPACWREPPCISVSCPGA